MGIRFQYDSLEGRGYKWDISDHDIHLHFAFFLQNPSCFGYNHAYLQTPVAKSSKISVVFLKEVKEIELQQDCNNRFKRRKANKSSACNWTVPTATLFCCV